MLHAGGLWCFFLSTCQEGLKMGRKVPVTRVRRQAALQLGYIPTGGYLHLRLIKYHDRFSSSFAPATFQALHSLVPGGFCLWDSETESVSIITEILLDMLLENGGQRAMTPGPGLAGCPFLQIRIYWSMAMPICLCVSSGYFVESLQ